MPDTRRVLRFRRYGRSYHLRIDSADTLAALPALDEALWVATSAPVDGFDCDPVFLALLDSNNDGRITCDEVRQAIRFAMDNLSDHSGILRRSDALTRADIKAGTPEGTSLTQAIDYALEHAGTKDTPQTVSLDLVRVAIHSIEAAGISSGMVLPQAVQDPTIRQLLHDVTEATGGVQHSSGDRAVDLACLNAFVTQARTMLDWIDQKNDPQRQAELLPLGDDTDAAWQTWIAVKDKISQYFAQCRLCACDPSLSSSLITRRQTGDINPNDQESIDAYIRNQPLAPLSGDQSLHLDDRINPMYADAIRRFHNTVVQPILGQPDRITPSDLTQIFDTFYAYETWQHSKPAGHVATIDPELLRQYCTEQTVTNARDVIAASLHIADRLANLRQLEKLLLYQHLLVTFLNSFVSFPDLYNPRQCALFEQGTLIMDGRRFDLAVPVSDRTRHSTLAKASNICVLYVELTPVTGGPPREVAVPVTSGGIGNLCVGKRGIFYDTRGREMNALVVHLLDNPISLGEAVAAPFKRLASTITEKIGSLTGTTEKNLDVAATTAVTNLQPSGTPQKPNTPLIAGGLLMGGSVAVAALGSAWAYIVNTLSTPEDSSKLLLAIAATILVILIPTAIVAYVRLRNRDLSAMLEGSGWGINPRMKLSYRQGHSFTRRPAVTGLMPWIRRWFWWAVFPAILIALGLLLWNAAKANTRVQADTNEPTTQQATP